MTCIKSTPGITKFRSFSEYFVICLLLASCTNHPTPGKPIEKDNGQPTESADVELARGEDVGAEWDDAIPSPKMPIVYFAFDSDKIDPAYAEDMSYAVMASRAQWACQVDGHASEEGTAEYNLALGMRRAAAVAGYIASFEGVTTKTTSYGEEKPMTTPELSRRVEIRCK